MEITHSFYLWDDLVRNGAYGMIRVYRSELTLMMVPTPLGTWTDKRITKGATKGFIHLIAWVLLLTGPHNRNIL